MLPCSPLQSFAHALIQPNYLVVQPLIPQEWAQYRSRRDRRTSVSYLACESLPCLASRNEGGSTGFVLSTELSHGDDQGTTAEFPNAARVGYFRAAGSGRHPRGRGARLDARPRGSPRSGTRHRNGPGRSAARLVSGCGGGRGMASVEFNRRFVPGVPADVAAESRRNERSGKIRHLVDG
jgi:hypothetical protein